MLERQFEKEKKESSNDKVEGEVETERCLISDSKPVTNRQIKIVGESPEDQISTSFLKTLPDSPTSPLPSLIRPSYSTSYTQKSP